MFASGRQRRRSVVIGALALTGALFATGCSSSGGTGGGGGGDAQELTLGASVEVTGPASAIGVEWQRGIELAVDAANGESGFTVGDSTYRWKLELDDNQSLPDQAIANYRQFTGDDVNFIAGPGTSTAFPPAFNSLGGATPFILTPSATAEQFVGNPAGENLFITHLADTGADGRVAPMVKSIVDRYHPESVAILLPQDAAGELYTDAFADAYADQGIDVVYSEAFPADTKDFSSYITALRAAGPDMVLSGYLNSWLAPLLSQSVDAGFTSPVFVGAPGTDATALPESGISQFAWSVTTRAVNNPDDPRVQGYAEAYETKYGEAPGAAAFWGLSYYDSILLLTKAIETAGSVDDLSAISEAFLAGGTVDNAVLDLSYDADTHRAVYGAQVGMYDDGAVTYEEAE